MCTRARFEIIIDPKSDVCAPPILPWGGFYGNKNRLVSAAHRPSQHAHIYYLGTHVYGGIMCVILYNGRMYYRYMIAR